MEGIYQICDHTKQNGVGSAFDVKFLQGAPEVLWIPNCSGPGWNVPLAPIRIASRMNCATNAAETVRRTAADGLLSPFTIRCLSTQRLERTWGGHERGALHPHLAPLSGERTLGQTCRHNRIFFTCCRFPPKPFRVQHTPHTPPRSHHRLPFLWLQMMLGLCTFTAPTPLT